MNENQFNEDKIVKLNVKRLFKITGALGTVGLFVLASYNTFQINSDGFMLDNEIKFVKRLDELNGIKVNGRIVAHNGNFKALGKAKKETYKPRVNTVSKTVSSPIVKKASSSAPEPAITKELNLELSQVFHPGKDLKKKKVSGSLQAYYGIIDSIDFNIEGVASVSLSKVGKLSGNVFEYSFGNETYTAMLYEQNKSTYMVTLTTGPKELQGLRLQFKNDGAAIEFAQDDSQGKNQEVAQDLNETKEEFDKGGFRDEPAPTESNEPAPAEYGFNFSA